MSLQTRLSALITAIKTETKALRTLISGTNNGNTSGLNTTATNLVDALNEVKVVADAAAGGGIAINDAAINATQTWSSSKIESRATEVATAQANSAVTTALEGEDLSDLADAVSALAAADLNLATAASVATLSTTVANKANSSDVYTQAELGNPETDLVALWAAA